MHARIAIWSARHRTLAILGWLAFVLAVSVLGGQIGTQEAHDTDYGHGDSGRANRIIAEAGFPEEPAVEMVIIQNGTPADRAAAAADVTRSLSGVGLDTAPEPLISPDGGSALVTFPLADEGKVRDALDAVAGVQDRHPGLYVAQTGPVSGDLLVEAELEDGLTTLGLLSIPLTLGILLVAFGAVVAALLPMALALTAIIAAGGLLAFASRVVPAVDATMHVMLVLGLAVGVDYCLFYIRRERDERRAGADPDRALLVAAQTSGRSVFISGLTVIIAMAGMFVTGDATFSSFGAGTILVVATAVLGSLTVLPAALSLLGDRVDAGKIPGLYRRRSDGRVWRAIVRVALARPLLSAIGATAVLLLLASPILDLKLKGEGLEDLSPSEPVVAAGLAVRDAFPAQLAPAEIVVRGTVPASTVEALQPAGEVQVNPAGTVTVIPSELSVDELRDDVLPRLLPGALVAGDAAEDADFNAQLSERAPYVFGFVLGLAFLLLWVSFRSVVVALTGVLLNLLSVAAAYGMLVFVFQYGHFTSLLDFTPAGGITNWLPLFMFITLFGLSMDYHVFVLSRIREGHLRGMPIRQAVSEGIGGTAGVITSAAVVMVVVFALFATLPIISMKQVGVGLAAAVLLDATIVRAVLLPAVMVLLGRRNWKPVEAPAPEPKVLEPV